MSALVAGGSEVPTHDGVWCGLDPYNRTMNTPPHITNMGDQREPDCVQVRTVGQESPGTSDAPPVSPVRPPGRRPGPGQPPGGAAAAAAGPGSRSVVTSRDHSRKEVTVRPSLQTCRPILN